MSHKGLSLTADFPWGITSERAAMLVAEGHKTIAAMAAELGVGTDTLKDWKKHPEFRERVKQILEASRKEALETGVLQKEGRIAALQELYQKLQQVVDERAADPEWADIPGWRTGLLVYKQKGLGSGDHFRTVDEFTDNLALVGELRNVLKQIAQETGQWVEKSETEHTITKVEVVYEDLTPAEL